MPTQCIREQLQFEGFDGRKVVAAFDGGDITSDAGSPLLRETDRAINLFGRIADCFIDWRDPDCTVHDIRTLVAQRIVAIALGYEDVDDHDTLRHDPVLAVLSQSLTPKRSDCAPLAPLGDAGIVCRAMGKSTLNRLEHAPAGDGTRYHKIGHDGSAIESLFVDLFLVVHDKPPRQIVLDLDATFDDARTKGVSHDAVLSFFLCNDFSSSLRMVCHLALPHRRQSARMGSTR